MRKTALDTTTLHEASEQAEMFESGKLYSMLDIFGGGTATCDNCGRWQRFAELTISQAQEHLARHGWTAVEGKDICPKCSAAKSV